MDLDSIPWQPTQFDGISVHVYGSERSGGRTLMLVSMAPGCSGPRQKHLGETDVLVLRGGYQDEFGVYSPGQLVRYAPGDEHGPRAQGKLGGEPCVLLALAREGIKRL